MTAARTRVVSNILQAPGTGKPLANKQVSIRLNVPAFIDGGSVEKARTTYLTTDANGEWTATLEVNADIDPAGSWYTVQELAGVIWTFVVTAGDLSPTTLRACLVDNPPNPTPLTAGIQSVQPGTNVTVDNTDPSNPIVSATGGGGSVTITSPDSSITVGGTTSAPTVEVTPGQFATFAQGAKADAAATQTALNTEATRAQNAEALLAPLASPTFTGHVAVPTPTSSSDAATKSYVDGLVTGLYDLRGAYDASVNTFPTSGGSGSAGAVVKGDTWVVSVAGTLGSKAVAVGDVVTAVVDTPGQTAANWSIIEHDLGYTPLNAASNLSDLTNATTARSNLGLGTAATHPATDFDTAGFTAADKTRLANTSGNNTGDQDLSALAPKASPALTGSPTVNGNALSGANTGDETGATIKTKLGVTTLSGSNTGDQTVGTTSGTVAAGDDVRFPPYAVTTVSTSGSSQTLTLASSGSTTFDVTLTANCTLTFAGSVSGKECVITLLARQDATGGRLVTWPAAVTWVGGTAPTLSTAAGAVDVVTFLTVNGGTTWYGFGGTISTSTASGWKGRSTGWFTQWGTHGTGGLVANTLTAAPLDVGSGTITALAMQVTTLAAGSSLRCGIYSDGGGIPGTLLVEATSSASLDSTTTGVKTSATISQIVSGRVWVAAVAQGGAPGVNTAGASYVPGVGYDTASNALGFIPNGYNHNGAVSGALPSTFVVNNATTTTPLIAARLS